MMLIIGEELSPFIPLRTEMLMRTLLIQRTIPQPGLILNAVGEVL